MWRQTLAEHAQVMDPWFSEETEGRHDREVMPHDLVRRLLLDDSFRPGERPLSIFGASGAVTMKDAVTVCLTRSQRVFKEYGQRPRRDRALDKWHSAGGNRSKKPLPSADKPLLWRWYGAVEQPIVDGTGTKRVATYNYHAYRLAEHADCTDNERIPVLYHLFTSRTLYKLEFPAQARTRRSRAPNDSGQSAKHPATQNTPGTPTTSTGVLSRTRRVVERQELQSLGSGDSAGPAMVLQNPFAEGQAKFISFNRRDTCIGDVSVNKTGGIALQSRAGDVAEWHELEKGHMPLLEGDIVSIVK